MRSFLRLTVAAAISIGGLPAASLLFPACEGLALAAKAAKTKKSKPPTNERSTPQTTGFEHQQCSIQQPCSTRNTW